MKIAILVLLLQCSMFVVSSEQADTRDLDDPEDLERKHRRRKKHQNNGGCGSGGYGKTFGEKFFGLHDYTYVSAPVMNYFFGCGLAAVPVQPVAPVVPIPPVHPVPAYPIQIGVSQSQGHQGQGGGGHGGGPGNHGGVGDHGGLGQGGFQGYNPGYNQPVYQPIYNQMPTRPFNNRPFQNVVSAAASGFGMALADYIGSRPRRTYNQINKQVNQLLRPLYKLF